MWKECEINANLKARELMKQKHTWEDSITINLEQGVKMWVGVIWLRIGVSGRLL